MPIRINLLAEAQAAEDLRRRDPIKRVIIGGVLLLAVMVVWSSWLEVKVMIVGRELSQTQIQIESQTNQYQLVMTNEMKITDAKNKLAALRKLTADRFLQGNLLNALQKVDVENVRLTRLKVDQAYILTEATSFKNRQGQVVSGKPATVTERIVVSLDAHDSSANPGDQVNKFKDALAKQPYFETMLNKTNGIRLANLSPPQTGPDGRGFVSFTLECRYPDRIR
jgi:hypothetical protein